MPSEGAETRTEGHRDHHADRPADQSRLHDRVVADEFTQTGDRKPGHDEADHAYRADQQQRAEQLPIFERPRAAEQRRRVGLDKRPPGEEFGRRDQSGGDRVRRRQILDRDENAIDIRHLFPP